MHAITEIQTKGIESHIHYDFFKAIYFNHEHYLCDFSKVYHDNNSMNYCVEIELPGKMFLHANLYKQGNDWRFMELPEGIDRNMEIVLSDAIRSHKQL